MNAPKFSPGPWHFREGQTLTGQFGYVEAADHNRIVADLPDYKHPSNWDECDEHNGRLIAAAPELYEALDCLRTTMACHDRTLEEFLALANAVAALAKAVQP